MVTLKKNNRAILLIIYLIVVLCLLFHSQYSFCGSDESFYISTTQRLFQGDRLMLDEWHPTQFYAPLLLPFYSIYVLITSSNQGIILFFRILYILFAALICWLFYRETVRENNLYASFFAAVIILLYTRANISGPSYYNLCKLFAVLSYTVLLMAERVKNSAAGVLRILSGVIVSFAVLCQPYMVLFVVPVIAIGLIKNKLRYKTLFISLGILLSAICYLISFLTRGSLQDYIYALKNILSDEQHQYTFGSLVHKVIHEHFLANSAIVIYITVCLIIYAFWVYLKKAELSRYYFMLQGMVIILSVVKPLMKISELPCYSFIGAFAISSIPIVLYNTVSGVKRPTILLYYLGIVVALSYGLGSNTGYDAMLTGYSISAAAAVVELYHLYEGYCTYSNIKVFVRTVFAIFCIVIVLFMGMQRALGFYRDASIRELSERITCGPAAGLLTTPLHAEEYNSIFNSLNGERNVFDDKSAHVFFTKKIPWAYLSTDLKSGALTTWTTELSSERMIYYIRNHQIDNMYVVICNENIGSFESCYFNNHKKEDAINAQVLEGKLYDLLKISGREVYSDDRIDVFYIKNIYSYLGQDY